MDFESCGITPRMASDIPTAYEYLRADGAALVNGIGPSEPEATGLGFDLFGSKVRAIPEAARVFAGGEQDRSDIDHTYTMSPHTDGFAYGDLYPDFIMLTCVRASATGGESYLIDGYALLDQLADEDSAFVTALQSVAVDQTEEDMQVSQSPIVQYTRADRRMLRRNFSTTPVENSENPERDQAMIDRWVDTVNEAGTQVPRFKVETGQALIMDNYRVLHAREAYEDIERMMWRVWIWTDECLGVPDMPLHSDSRYAQR